MSEFGDSERLDPDDARQLIVDIVAYMQRRAYNAAKKESSSVYRKKNKTPSIEKQLYGDTWTFLYGIKSGMDLMLDEHHIEMDWENGERVDKGIRGDDSWQEYYDEYGYGAHGRGLEIGKRLAFYEERDFTFSSATEESESKFTFVE